VPPRLLRLGATAPPLTPVGSEVAASHQQQQQQQLQRTGHIGHVLVRARER